MGSARSGSRAAVRCWLPGSVARCGRARPSRPAAAPARPPWARRPWRRAPVTPCSSLTGRELGHELLGLVDRDREAQADVAGLRADAGDGGGDPDDLAGGVHQRPARVAGVDRGVGLDGVADGHGRPAALVDAEAAVQGADDAGGDRPFQAERAADGQHGVADLEGVAVAQGRGLEPGDALRPDDRQVGGRVGGDDAGGAVVPSPNATVIRPPCAASATTWLLVRMSPSDRTITPEPSAAWPAARTVIDTTLGWTAAATAAKELVVVLPPVLTRVVAASPVVRAGSSRAATARPLAVPENSARQSASDDK